jgi:hypothetical protein
MIRSITRHNHKQQTAQMIEDAEQRGLAEVPVYEQAQASALDREYLLKVTNSWVGRIRLDLVGWSRFGFGFFGVDSSRL